MTVNLRPSGRLLRINKGPNCISDFHPAVGRETGPVTARIHYALNLSGCGD